MPDSLVLLEIKESVAHLIIDRADVRNALDEQTVQHFHTQLDRLADESDLAAVVVRGEGGKAFVSGADISELKERGAAEAFRRINQGLFRRLEEFPLPTIAAIHGFALGGGLELALACDLRVAGISARLGQPEVGLGIIPGAGGTHRLPRTIGIARARELIFTARIIDADQALAWGLVNHVVPDHEVVSRADELAQEIAKNSRQAVRLAKTALSLSQDLGDRGRDMVEVLSQAICFESEDKHERMGRFLDKRRAKRRR